jgi:branched-chain amino acid transport system ATP-binding protein
MHKGARVLHDEHLAISAVLQALQHLARMAQDPGVKADFRAFHAMIHYIDAFPERQHHPKEDQVLFARLWERSAEARPLVERLKAEHVEGARLVRNLEAAVRKYEEAWPRGAQDFAAAVQAYADFHWRHMRCEEQELLPLAEHALSEEDWTAVERAFAQNEDPIADLRGQDFDRLYTHILSLAPAPIGLGEPWKRA